MLNKYKLEAAKKREKEQEDELNQVLAKLRSLATQEGGGSEVEELREELERTKIKLNEWKKLFKQSLETIDSFANERGRLLEQIHNLEEELQNQGPVIVQSGSKKTKVRESNSQDEDVKKWKSMAEDCLKEGIPRGMTLEKAMYIQTLCDRLSEPEQWQKIINDNKVLIDKLERLVKYFGYKPTSEDRDDMEKEANEYFKDLLTGDMPGTGFVDKRKSFGKNMEWVNKLKTKEKEVAFGKKRILECRVCGKVGGRLLCEETPPHRVFCGLVCQSKFYY